MHKLRLRSVGIAILMATLYVFIANAHVVARPNVSNDLPMLNMISGQIWDTYRRPIPNLYIELQNEVGSTLDRQRTTESGFYRFSGISSGRFKLHVITLGSDFLEQTQDVQILNLQQGMSDSQYVDFYLKYDPKRVKIGIDGTTDEVFVQEGVSSDAEKLYKKGVSLSDEQKSDLAIVAFTDALKLAPHYYQALNALGNELVKQKKYREALDPLIKAIDLNQRSFTGYYALAYSCFELKEIPQANEAARAATILKPASINAQLLYGTTLRLFGDLALAEKALVKAKTLGNNKVARVNYQLALVYNKLKRNREAADELEMYLRNQSNAPDEKEVQDLIAKLRNAPNNKFQ